MPTESLRGKFSRDHLVIFGVRFFISAIVVMTVSVALYLGNQGYQVLRERHVRRVYDAQKRVVDAANDEFVAELTSEGFHIINDPGGVGGSGDWRKVVAVSAWKTTGESEVCYVEVQGFVAHNAANEPVWTKNLPMTISFRGKSLDARFVEELVAKLNQQHWEFELNDRCRGNSRFRIFEEDGEFGEE